MNKYLLCSLLALVSGCSTVAAATPGEGKVLGASAGLMYSRAVFTCGTLPAELVADYVKASKLIAGPSAEYDEGYAQVVARGDRNWPAIPSAEQRALECQKSKEDLAIKVKIAQRWFPDAYK